MSEGLYIHVPFCQRKCPYCDFYSRAFDESAAERFTDALINQMRSFSRRSFDTVYFGGGTPSLLSEKQVERILDAAGKYHSVERGAEVTLELNPATADRQKLRDYRASGVSRLSVGVQSLNDGTLKRIGRLHTAEQALLTLSDAREAGFQNISADVMLALPRENAADALRTLDGITARGINHVSAYLLKIAPDTPFGARTPDGLPDDDQAAEIYEAACAFLSERGLRRYEISNFAAEGFESRHNLKYWDCGEYLGLGPAAASSLRGRLYSAPADTDGFIEFFSSPQGSPSTFWRDDGALDQTHYIMLRLRTEAGLSQRELQRRFNCALSAEKLLLAEKYAAAGLLRLDGDAVSLTTKGILVSNSIISELM